MRLFHTGPAEIQKPDLCRGRKNADFGQGFYLTPDRTFAKRWASGDDVINEYELDLNGLQIHHFVRDAAWFQYIFENRRLQDNLADDVVIGPIANDTIFDTMGIVTSGYLTPEEAMQLLMIGPEYTQVTVKTAKAVQQLQWISSTAVSDHEIYKAALQVEQDAYQKLFAETLERLVTTTEDSLGERDWYQRGSCQ